jgi:ATP-binding cassette subfamily B (MDR/TAP) protein 1
MEYCGPLSVPIFMGTNISVEKCPTTPIQMEDMDFVLYDSGVGSLMYFMICIRPNITQAMGVLSQFMANFGCEHWVVVNRVFKYLQGTFEYSIYYHSNVSGDVHSLYIQGYVDYGWERDIHIRISMRGYMFRLFNGAIS